MRFTQEELDQAIAEFQSKAAVRVVPAFGFNKDITVYGEGNGTIQAPVGDNSGDAEPGTE